MSIYVNIADGPLVGYDVRLDDQTQYPNLRFRESHNHTEYAYVYNAQTAQYEWTPIEQLAARREADGWRRDFRAVHAEMEDIRALVAQIHAKLDRYVPMQKG